MEHPSAGTTAGGGAMTLAAFGVDGGESSPYFWDSDPAFATVISFDASFTYSDLDRSTSLGVSDNTIAGATSLAAVEQRPPIQDGIRSGHDADPSTSAPLPSQPSFVFSNLARQFASRQPAAQPRTHLPATSPLDRTFDPTAWEHPLVKSAPEIDQQYPTHHTSSCSSSPTVDDVLDLDLTVEFSQDWTTDHLVTDTTGTSGACLLSASHFNTTFDSFDAVYVSTASGSSSTEHNAPLFTESHCAPSPGSTVTLDYKTRASTAFSEATVTGPPRSRPTARSRKPKGTSKNVGCLNIIQYKPSGGDGPLVKKRPALDEIFTEDDAPQTLRQIDLVNGSGQVEGSMSTFGKRAKTRNAFTLEKRQQTALVRKEGVCARCKKSKRQCDLALQVSPYISCSLCASTKLYKNVSRMPCFRSTLLDILFFRNGPAANEPLFTKRGTVYHLEDPSKPDVPVRTLKLTQNIGSQQLTVYASEFVPKPEDVTSYRWKDPSGISHDLPMPPFCLTNIEKVHSHYLQYIQETKWTYLGSLQRDDELSWMTVRMGMAYAKKRPDSLVADVLSLWAISRMIEIPWEMCGEDTLGVDRIRNPENPNWHNKVPIPPIMDTQLDQIVIKNILKPLRQQVIDKFQKLVTPAKPEAWFEIYLAAFVMLNHIERLAKHSVSHARMHSMPTKYSNIKFLEAAFHTAKVILSRFHFVCNGSVPLKCDWTSTKTIEMARLEGHEVEFMKNTQAMIRQREMEVLTLRASRKYESSLYWSHQLFIEDWDKSANNSIEG
ncbi:hypothetical protein QBC44DRAFT_335102 [Cladorrhinum sp. PSN332]|nr:hypothetical protein QBC44DRAFT_335102 [Cladorrhinum sp. PSN332]